MSGRETRPGPEDIGEKTKAPRMTPGQIEHARRKKGIVEFSSRGAGVPDDRREMDKPIFDRGQEVRVKRKSGAVEEDWVVTDPQPDEKGRITVVKRGFSRDDKIENAPTKRVREEDLAEWNS